MHFCIAQPLRHQTVWHLLLIFKNTSSVNQLQSADLIGGLGEGLVTVAENSKADGQNTVSYSLGVCPCAGVKKEEHLEVGNEENGGPHPEGQEEKSRFQSHDP